MTEPLRTSPAHPLVAHLLDPAMASLHGVRRKLVPLARGRVLEIGVGTGLNLLEYEGVEQVVGIEPDPHMLRRAQARVAQAKVPVTVQRGFAESLEFADGSFDTVVATWVLCTIADPVAALAEVYRVLVPGGVLLFAEHTRSRFGAASTLQRWLTPAWSRCAGECRLDRDSIHTIAASGFAIEACDAYGREGWTLTPVYYGQARRPSP